MRPCARRKIIDALRNEHARQTQEPKNSTPQQNAPAKQEPESRQGYSQPTRPTQTHPPQAWSEKQDLKSQVDSANAQIKYNAGTRNAAASATQQRWREPDKDTGKKSLGDDLKEARESTASKESGRDTGRTR